jgi:signal transduction histidine kinase
MGIPWREAEIGIKMPENINQIGIGFFGTVMASISHELKNRIAIIKEQAGLLKDYSAMAEKGRKINFDRLGRLGQGMTDQVVKADIILKNMNQFAHSVDIVIRPTDLNDLLGLSISLAKHLADLHRINLKLRATDPPIKVTTSPFFLMNLIWLCLETLIRAADNPGTIEMELGKKDQGGGLIRMHSDAAELKPDEQWMPENLKFLADALEADVEWKRADNLILVHLQADITNYDRIKGPQTMLG